MSTDKRSLGVNQQADFYLGRGENAEYLGSMTAVNAAPEDIDVWLLFQSLDNEPVTDDTYRAEVAQLVNHTTWPWTSRTDSVGTPWSYMFDRGTLYVYRYGVELARIVANYTVPSRSGGRELRAASANQFPVVA